MSLTNNIPETMVPGSYTGFNFYAGPNGLPANIQKVLLIGDVSSAGSLAVETPTEVGSESEAYELAGAGSVLMQMYKAAKKAWKYAQITMLRHAAVTGSAASWAFTLTGAATKAGKVTVICNGIEYAVGVAKTDAPDAIAVGLADAINKTPDAPFTAVATTEEVTDQTTHETSNVPTGEVVLTAKCKGAYVSAAAGGLNVSVNSEAEGITAGSITATAGVGTVDIETALAAAFPERYHIIVSPVNDSTTLGHLKTHLEAAAAPLEQRGQRAVCAVVSATASAAKALALAQNYERLHIAAVKNKINAIIDAWNGTNPTVQYSSVDTLLEDLRFERDGVYVKDTKLALEQSGADEMNMSLDGTEDTTSMNKAIIVGDNVYSAAYLLYLFQQNDNEAVNYFNEYNVAYTDLVNLADCAKFY